MRPKRIDASDVLVAVGLSLLAVGLWFVDWRLACVVCGLIVLILGLLGALRAS